MVQTVSFQEIEEGVSRGSFWSPLETGVNEIFHFKDHEKVIRDRKESSHRRSTPEAHENMGLERMDLTIAAYEGKRKFAACIAEGSLASRTCS